MKSKKPFLLYSFLCSLLPAAVILTLTACGDIDEASPDSNQGIGNTTVNGDTNDGCPENESGNNGSGNNAGSGDARPENSVYLPTFFTPDGTYIDYNGIQPSGETICYLSVEPDETRERYIQCINLYSPEDKSHTSSPLTWLEEPENIHLNQYVFGADAELYALAVSYSQDASGSKDYLCRFDSRGNCLLLQDITESLREDPESQTYISTMLLDKEQNIYLQGNENIWLYDKEGIFQGMISPASSETAGNHWINAMFPSEEGRMYISYTLQGSPSRSYTLAELDFERKSLTVITSDFPENNAFAVIPANSDNDDSSDALIGSDSSAGSGGSDNPSGSGDSGGSSNSVDSSGSNPRFLMQDRSSLYLYDPVSQEKELLLNWMDCDINGNEVLNFWEEKNGSIVAVLSGSGNTDGEIAALTKVGGDQVIQKENIVLAVLTDGYNYQSAVVDFNKSSDKYHITIKEYRNEENRDSVSWADALTKLYMDIASGECPDIIELTGLNVGQLAQKNAFEDLTPYLADSTLLHADDFLEEILAAYTFNDALVCIPSRFFLETVIGNRDQVGPDAGWTLEELFSLADANPKAELFDSTDRADLLSFIMQYNEDAFIDWTTGQCSFTSEAFQNVLNFVNKFPNEVNPGPDQPAAPIRIQNGEVLLKNIWLYDFNSIQMEIAPFQGKAVCIGFPTAEGKSRHALTAAFAYAIPARAKQKDGAWAFIESFLAEESAKENNRNQMGFPTVKWQLEAMIEDAVKVEYLLDENGELYLDENGEPIVIGNTSTVSSGGGWSYTYHTTTREEVDMILGLLDGAVPVYSTIENEILDIIIQEAQTFFQGQKSADEAAEIIQSRIELYVNERR